MTGPSSANEDRRDSSLGRCETEEGTIDAIDVHAHFYPPHYVAEVGVVAGGTDRASEIARAFLSSAIIGGDDRFTSGLDRRLAMMDAAGIAIQVLSMASMNVWHPVPDVRAHLVRAYNDGLSEVCVRYPDRFRFLASLPLPHVGASVDEVSRVRGLPGCIGYSIPTTIDATPLDAPELGDVYDAMGAEESLVALHPDGFAARGHLADYSMEWAIGAPFEDTVAAVRLLCSGILSANPRLHWVVPHLGGTLPFVLHRLVWRWRFEAEHLGTPAYDSRHLDRLLFDTANSTPETIQMASRVLPAGSLLYGTDFPFLDKRGFEESLALARAVPDFREGAGHRVLRDLVRGGDRTTTEA